MPLLIPATFLTHIPSRFRRSGDTLESPTLLPDMVVEYSRRVEEHKGVCKNMGWDTAQPRGNVEKANVAAEAMGTGSGNRKKRSPRFHRMSIAAAENGVTVEHTVEHFDKSPKERGAGSHPVPSDFGSQKTTNHVFGNSHPMMHHIRAIHDHISGSAGPDADGD